MATLTPVEQRALETEKAKATGRYIELSDDEDEGGRSVQPHAPVDAQAEVQFGVILAAPALLRRLTPMLAWSHAGQTACCR